MHELFEVTLSFFAISMKVLASKTTIKHHCIDQERSLKRSRMNEIQQ